MRGRGCLRTRLAPPVPPPPQSQTPRVLDGREGVGGWQDGEGRGNWKDGCVCWARRERGFSSIGGGDRVSRTEGMACRVSSSTRVGLTWVCFGAGRGGGAKVHMESGEEVNDKGDGGRRARQLCTCGVGGWVVV
mgnify:CR=1 FL=1